MKIYIAAKFEDQAIMRQIVGQLEKYGIDCTSRWLFERQHSKYGKGLSARFIAERDLEDIRAASLLVCFNQAIGPDSGTVGRHVEAGYVIGKLPIIYVGMPQHTFRTLPGMHIINEWDGDVVAFSKRLALAVKRVLA
jgi:hypothetical protein